MIQAFRQAWQVISRGPRERQAIALLRAAMGLGFLAVGQYQLSHPQLEAQWLVQWQSLAASNPLPLYRDFLQLVVIPHFHGLLHAATDAVMWIGASYVAGLWVSLSSCVVLFLSINFLLATQHANPALVGLNGLVMLIAGVLAWGKAGQHFGLDGLWARAWSASQRPRTTKTSKVTRRTSPTAPKKSVRTPSGKSGRTGVLRQVSKGEKSENIRPFERPKKSGVAPAKIRKLETAVKREMEKQKQQATPDKPEKAEKNSMGKPLQSKTAQPSESSASVQAPQDNHLQDVNKVVKIFDHRTPDDDD